MHILIFPFFIGVSVLTGLIWIRDIAPQKQENLYLDIGVGLLAGVLIGSRIVYVIFQWNYFKDRWLEIPQFQMGGYSWAGGVLGWIIAMVIVSYITRQSALQLSDAFIPLGGCLVIGIWLGCWFDGIAYGYLSDRWWALPAVDEWGAIEDRFPVQFIGAISTWLVMLGMDGLKNQTEEKRRLRSPGISTALFLMGLSLVTFILAFFRHDPAPFWMGYRLEMWISLACFLLGGIILVVITVRQKLAAYKNSYLASQL